MDSTAGRQVGAPGGTQVAWRSAMTSAGSLCTRGEGLRGEQDQLAEVAGPEKGTGEVSRKAWG